MSSSAFVDVEEKIKFALECPYQQGSNSAGSLQWLWDTKRSTRRHWRDVRLRRVPALAALTIHFALSRSLAFCAFCPFHATSTMVCLRLC